MYKVTYEISENGHMVVKSFLLEDTISIGEAGFLSDKLVRGQGGTVLKVTTNNAPDPKPHALDYKGRSAHLR